MGYHRHPAISQMLFDAALDGSQGDGPEPTPPGSAVLVVLDPDHLLDYLDRDIELLGETFADAERAPGKTQRLALISISPVDAQNHTRLLS